MRDEAKVHEERSFIVHCAIKETIKVLSWFWYTHHILILIQSSHFPPTFLDRRSLHMLHNFIFCNCSWGYFLLKQDRQRPPWRLDSFVLHITHTFFSFTLWSQQYGYHLVTTLFLHPACAQKPCTEHKLFLVAFLSQLEWRHCHEGNSIGGRVGTLLAWSILGTVTSWMVPFTWLAWMHLELVDWFFLDFFFLTFQ